MSGAKKRLTDEGVAAQRHNVLNGGDHDILDADHDLAREDVKRLAETLVATSGWPPSSAGHRCWCHDGPCFRLDGQAGNEDCRRASALLAEVGA